MNWFECAACDHVFTDGYFTQESLDLLFGQTHQSQKVGVDIENQRAISARMIENVLPYAQSGNWLDVGFGNGSLLFTAQEYGFVPVGVDLRSANVEDLRNFGIEAHCVDVVALGQPARFSVASLADVLQHMPYPAESLRSIHELLCDRGILFLSMPNMDSVLWKSLELKNENPYWQELEHYHNFGRRRLYALLQECGFEPLRFGISERHRAGMEVVARKKGGIRPANPNGPDLGSSAGALTRLLPESNAAPASRDPIPAEPETADSLNARGFALQEQRRHGEALDCFDRALALQPDNVHALNNRGNALLDLARHEEALASYDRVLQLDPGYAEAFNNKGCALIRLGRHDEALDCMERAVALRPDYAQAVGNRAYVLHQLHRHEEALDGYARASSLAPGNAETSNNCGNVLLDLGRYEEALASYDRALASRPDYADALNNRGCALLNLKRYDEALDSLSRAITLRPDYPVALNNHGYALQQLRRFDQALTSFERSLALEPGYVEALNNCGNVLLDLKRPAEALARYDHTLELSPNHADALHNRGSALVELGRNEEAAESFSRLTSIAPDHDYPAGKALDCRLRYCDWTGYERAVAEIEAAVASGKKAAFPFFFLSVSSSAANQLQCARTYVADKFPACDPPLWRGSRYRHDKIRVAYLSADYHEHATAYLMAELFETHDRGRFETTAVSFGPDRGNPMRDRLKMAFDGFLEVGTKSDREVAQMLRKMEIDIAVDLKAFTTDGRVGILAHRPAPLQVNYLGYPGTMGADYIDYIVADRFVVPPGHDVHYSEKVVRLPDTYQVNDSKRRIAERTPGRTALGLPETGFVFCCFNNNYKIAPPVFDVWMRLLRNVEGSVLWLLGADPATLRNLRREAEKRGVAANRLVFAQRMGLDDHLARHRQADLFLDTLPYNAHTTTSDALWAGLPVLTYLGSTFAGRVAASLLNAANLPELITHSLEDYEALALRLARTPALLAGIRQKVANNRGTCPLFDTARFRRHLESAYLTMWERNQRGLPPQSFDVPTMQ